MRRPWTAVPTLIVLLLVLPAAARAQMPTVTKNGGPAAGVDVFMYLNGGKQPAVSINPAMLTNKVRPGTHVDVYRRECEDGKIQIIMVPAGEQLGPDDQDCDKNTQAPAGAGCACHKVGAFIWGDRVTIDAGTGRISSGSSSSGGGGVSVFGHGGYKRANFGDAVDTACAAIDGLYQSAAYDTSACAGSASRNGFELGGGVGIPLAGPVSLENRSLLRVVR